MKRVKFFPNLFFKYLVIILTLNGLHYLYKFYDRSYVSLWQYDLRASLFHIYFVLYGLLVWKIAIRLTTKANHYLIKKHVSQNRRFLILGIILIIYGWLFTVSYGYLYYNLFFVCFNVEHFWADYSLFDRELTVMMYVLFLIIIGFHLFIYYFRNWQEAELTAERLQKENIRSQYEALKNQIEPHFFFNSLSVLASLVDKDKELASDYITQLSKMYRYLLEGKNQTIVQLSHEVEFLNAYIFLMKVRHRDSIHFSINLSDETLKYMFIPKNSLQMLAENAVKHNRFSKESPLSVRIAEDGNYIKVTNNLNRRELLEESSEIGLQNIRKRYELISDKEIEIEETAFTFCVKLPKLKKGELKSIDI